MKKEIFNEKEIIHADKIIKKNISKSKDYIVFDKMIPWKKFVIENSDLKFVIFPEEKDNWIAHAVPKKAGSFESRKYFPKKWAGLENKELQKITGVCDAKFCHKNLFIATAKSKESAIELVKLSLKK